MIGSGRTALVTGASSGLGRALVELFAADGWRPILVARSADALSAAAGDLSRRFGVDAVAIPSDLAADDAARRLFGEVSARGLTVDALVNNAGFATYGPFAQGSLDDDHQEIVVNVVALTDLTRLFLAPMLARKYGKILNVASTAGFQPGPTWAVYGATKAYVLSFSEAIADEVSGSGVTVTCFAPGAFESSFIERAKMRNTALYKGKRLAGSGEMALAAYRAMLAGKRLEIPGAYNKLTAFAGRFGPRGIVMKLTRRAYAQR